MTVLKPMQWQDAGLSRKFKSGVLVRESGKGRMAGAARVRLVSLALCTRLAFRPHCFLRCCPIRPLVTVPPVKGRQKGFKKPGVRHSGCRSQSGRSRGQLLQALGPGERPSFGHLCAQPSWPKRALRSGSRVCPFREAGRMTLGQILSQAGLAQRCGVPFVRF